jgi:hypothetical protein
MNIIEAIKLKFILSQSFYIYKKTRETKNQIIYSWLQKWLKVKKIVLNNLSINSITNKLIIIYELFCQSQALVVKTFKQRRKKCFKISDT